MPAVNRKAVRFEKRAGLSVSLSIAICQWGLKAIGARVLRDKIGLVLCRFYFGGGAVQLSSCYELDRHLPYGLSPG